MSEIKWSKLGALIAVAPLALWANVAFAQSYRLTQLGDNNAVSSINNLGQVVGTDTDGNSSMPFLWSNGTTSLLGGGVASAVDINDAGQITGGLKYKGSTHAYLYADGKVRDLDPSGYYSYGTSINSAGLVAGTHGDAAHGLYASTFGSKILDLVANPTSNAVFINDSGQVGGTRYVNEPDDRLIMGSFLYTNGSLRQDVLIGGSRLAFANGMNNRGEIVGMFENSSLQSDSGFVLSPRYPDVSLDPDIRYTESFANAINDKGVIVGGVADCPQLDCGGTPNNFAFVYKDGKIVDLNTLLDHSSASGWKLENAIDINNRGQIVGVGINALGQERAFMITPVPEPATRVLAFIGLGMVSVAALRRKQH